MRTTLVWVTGSAARPEMQWSFGECGQALPHEQAKDTLVCDEQMGSCWSLINNTKTSFIC